MIFLKLTLPTLLTFCVTTEVTLYVGHETQKDWDSTSAVIFKVALTEQATADNRSMKYHLDIGGNNSGFLLFKREKPLGHDPIVKNKKGS